MAFIKVQVLTEAGTKAMIEEYNGVKNAGEGHKFNSANILANPNYLDTFLEGKMEIVSLSSGASRAVLAKTIFDAFNNVGESVSDHIDNPGLWNWFMVQYGPVHHFSLEGHKLTAIEKYVHQGDGYRHHLANIAWVQETIERCGYGKLLLTPARKKNKEASKHEQEMKFGEAQEQVTQGHIMRSDACFQLVEHMFYDEVEKYWKPGIASNSRPDSLRKLKKFLYRLDTVYDVYSMSYEELLIHVITDGRFNKRLLD
jgi:hypothetical protein